MHNTHSRILFILFLLLALGACQSTRQPYQLAFWSGFGGTGQKMDPASGFGGTGHGSSSGFGGTGIIGTITAFGSIWVNGIEIEYDQNTPIHSDLSENKTELKIGQQVVLETKPNDLETIADHIKVYYPLAGKIEAIDSKVMTVNGQQVKLAPHTLKDSQVKLEKGTFVAVSAVKNDRDQWVASRINHNPQRQVFYHPKPELNFSEQISRLIIEDNLLKHADIMDLQHLSVQFRHSHISQLRELNELRGGKHENLRELREGLQEKRELHELREMNEQFEDSKELRELQEQSQELKELKELKEDLEELREVHDEAHDDD